MPDRIGVGRILYVQLNILLNSFFKVLKTSCVASFWFNSIFILSFKVFIPTCKKERPHIFLTRCFNISAFSNFNLSHSSINKSLCHAWYEKKRIMQLNKFQVSQKELMYFGNVKNQTFDFLKVRRLTHHAPIYHLEQVL